MTQAVGPVPGLLARARFRFARAAAETLVTVMFAGRRVSLGCGSRRPSRRPGAHDGFQGRRLLQVAFLGALLLVSLVWCTGDAAGQTSPGSLPASGQRPATPAGGPGQPRGEPLFFTPPSEADIPHDGFGDMVRRGIAIFTNTPNEARGFVGDGLTCSNCHLDRGRRPGAAPMWAAWVRYPQFRAKNEAVNTMAMRIQGCFKFSMNGTAPPEDSEVITALQSYFFWLARGIPTGAKLHGEGFTPIPEPPLAPAHERGAAVFASKCAACHGADGLGRRATGAAGYQFPPLWGADSFNWGAGMTSVATAAGFIRANMPYGLREALSVQEAWDVAFFMDGQERPQDPRFTGDLAETRARFHNSKWSLYGTEQAGVRLGDPGNYPLPRGP